MSWTFRLGGNTALVPHISKFQGLAQAELIVINRHFNSHTVAWQQTRGDPGFPKDEPPCSHLIWLTTAMGNATSWIHIDANGLATIVDGVTGTKYWVVCRRRDTLPPHGPGDGASIHAYHTTEIDSASTEIFEHEAIVIKPGTLL
jgi:hypothetical protein